MQGKEWNVHDRDSRRYQTKVTEVTAYRLEKDQKTFLTNGTTHNSVAGEWIVTFPSGGSGVMTDAKFREIYYVD